MSYEQALKKAWTDISNLAEDKRITLKFLADEYDIDLENKRIFSISCNIPAKQTQGRFHF